MIRVRGLAIVLTLSLLLIPATCASVAGPHSLFMDPMANHEHHSSDDDSSGHDDHVVMTQAELELHVLLGHISVEQADAIETGEADSLPSPAKTQLVEKNPCEDGGPRVKDLPSSMAMAAAMNPVVLDDPAMIELPCAEAPVATIALAPAPMAHSPESPPPQG